MRKNLTLLIAGILLLASAGVAQGQGAGVYEIFSNAVNARTGGAAELSGNVVLFLQTGNHSGGSVTLKYSAPLAKGTAPEVTGGGADPQRPTRMRIRSRLPCPAPVKIS